MQFVHPLFLFAFASLAIPVIIHLFNFRRFKKVYFTNVRFLDEIQQETKRQSELKQIIILLDRLLTISALIVAFAQPYIPGSLFQKKSAGQTAISIYIDNSFSMEAMATQGRLIDIAKSKAVEIASLYQKSDVFQLMTNDYEGKHQYFVSKEEFGKLVEEVQPSPKARKLSEIITRQKELLSSQSLKNREAFLISDFQKQFADFSAIHPDTNASWFLVPVTYGKRNNLYIDSVFFESPVHQPDQQVKLKIRIRNASEENLEKIPVKLRINNIQKALASISVPAESSDEVILPFTENLSGIQNGMLELTDYPVTYDDLFYFSYPILPSIPVLTINGIKENQYLHMIFGTDSAFRYFSTSDKNVNYSSIPGYPLVILNGLDQLSSGLRKELSKYILDGGNIIIFPPEQIESDAYDDFLAPLHAPVFLNPDTNQQRVSGIALESDVFSDIFEKNAEGKISLQENADFPSVLKHYTFRKVINSNLEILMKLQNGHAFLVKSTAGKGKIYLFASPLDEKWTNFPRHLLFLPTLYKIALLSLPSPQLYYNLGNELGIELTSDSLNEKKMLSIKKNDGDFEMIPEIRMLASRISLFLHDQIKEPGWYTVFDEKTKMAGLAFNYDRHESDLKCLTVKEIHEQMRRFQAKNVFLLEEKKVSIATQIKEINQGTPIWKYFIILALIFLAVEILLLRLLKS